MKKQGNNIQVEDKHPMNNFKSQMTPNNEAVAYKTAQTVFADNKLSLMRKNQMRNEVIISGKQEKKKEVEITFSSTDNNTTT